MKQKLFWLLGVLSVLFVIAACGQESGSEPQPASTSHSHEQVMPNGDTRVETASSDVMPAFLEGRSEQVKLAYAAAVKLKDTLPYIPCYCGCGQSAGHKSNLECFIAEIKEDGSVVWDDHGTVCGVCQKIALQAAKLKSEGKTNLEIRTFVDQTYGAGGYADPTDTPLPTV